MAYSQLVIPRNNPVPGQYTEDEYYRDGFLPAEATSLVVTLETAVVQALNTSPVTLVEAPPAGYYVAVFGVFGRKQSGSYAASDAINIRWAATTPVNFAHFQTSYLNNANLAQDWAGWVDPSGPPNHIPPRGVSLQAYSGSDSAGAGGDLTLTVVYVVLKA